MRLTLRQLQIFIAVASTGSTTAAASQVALSQSATSGALNELEHLLAIGLFDRVGKRLLINDNGRLLLPQARQILALANAVERQFAEQRTQTRDLRIAASTTIGTYILPDLIAAYRRRCAELIPRVTIANTLDVATAVADFEADIGFIEGPCHVAGLHIEPWIADQLVIVAAPSHRLADAAAAPIGAAVLAQEKWLLREAGSGTREAVEDVLLPYLHRLQEGGEFSSSEAIKRACAAGLGLTCLSHTVVADLVALGRLVTLSTELPPLNRALYMIYSSKKTLSPALEDFCEFCRARRHP